jgi:nucleoside-diphosphate-sugar epimerase
VYGPFSIPFTVVPVHELRTGRVVVPFDDESECNLVYVDDVVDALRVSGTHPGAANERFIINGPQTIPWHALYQHYAGVIGEGEILRMHRDEIEALAVDGTATAAVRRLAADPRYVLSSSVLSPVRRAVRRIVGPRLWQRARRVSPLPLVVPDRGNRAFRWTPYAASADKAERVLGFRPRVQPEQGLALAAEFVRWARL